MRRASESCSVVVHNKSGIDIEVVVESERPHFVSSGNASVIGAIEGDDLNAILRVSKSSASLIGDREMVKGLSISRRGNPSYVFLLKSSLPFPSFHSGPMTTTTSQEGLESGFFRCIEGRSSPESMLTDITVALDWGYYNAEPVVEWCMQNQRLMHGVSDLFSLSKGKDFLSNTVWSPEDDLLEDNQYLNPYSLGNKNEAQPSTPERLRTPPQTRSNWQAPFLSEDPPEFTDMTCMLRMARERLMLPDNRWIWVNDWSVDTEGTLEIETDADGWSYAMDFETFSNTKCYYERGAACRRRRWTRTVRFQ
jgi:Integral peroxisomal membrane peroxin